MAHLEGAYIQDTSFRIISPACMWQAMHADDAVRSQPKCVESSAGSLAPKQTSSGKVIVENNVYSPGGRRMLVIFEDATGLIR